MNGAMHGKNEQALLRRKLVVAQMVEEWQARVVTLLEKDVLQD